MEAGESIIECPGLRLQLVSLRVCGPGWRVQTTVYDRRQLIRVMCTGRVTWRSCSGPLRGEGRVFHRRLPLGGLSLRDGGNYHALHMVHLCRKLLEHVGLNPERLRIEWISAARDSVRRARR